jgi:hypothetical protein
MRFCALDQFGRGPLAQLRHSSNFFNFGGDITDISLKLADAFGLALWS